MMLREGGCSGEDENCRKCRRPERICDCHGTLVVRNHLAKVPSLFQALFGDLYEVFG